MKRIVFFLLVAAAVALAWRVVPGLLKRQPHHQVVILNRSGADLVDLRLQVAGRTFEADTLAAGRDSTFEFLVRRDAVFDLRWDWAERPGGGRWHGGLVPPGPLVKRHRITIDGEGGVVYRAGNLPAPRPKRRKPAARG